MDFWVAKKKETPNQLDPLVYIIAQFLTFDKDNNNKQLYPDNDQRLEAVTTSTVISSPHSDAADFETLKGNLFKRYFSYLYRQKTKKICIFNYRA